MKISLKEYDIEFGPARTALSEYLGKQDYSSINVLVDENTGEHCWPLVEGELKEASLIEIKSGEQNKVLDTCRQIWSALQQKNVDRHGILINLGGGVIGDMGGFVAATYMRGIDFIQVPTTLLSQVDASVGGKLGVDFNGYKNFIGLFRNPQMVLIDDIFLNTLPGNELRSGYAEMIKHSLIRDDKAWKIYIEAEKWQENITTEEIFRSVNIKKDVVHEDPFEKGLRKILNFGHTIGHAIETESFNTKYPLLHGHAIGLGMIAEAFLSHSLCGLPTEDLESITDYLLSIYPRRKDLALKHEKIARHVLKDKKNKDGKVLFTLLQEIGSSKYNVEVSNDQLFEAMDYLANI